MFEIVRSSVNDLPSDLTVENEVRYKLIIDSSEDLSLSRFLFIYKVLSRMKTKLLLGTKFPCDGELEKVSN